MLNSYSEILYAIKESEKEYYDTIKQLNESGDKKLKKEKKD